MDYDVVNLGGFTTHWLAIYFIIRYNFMIVVAQIDL